MVGGWAASVRAQSRPAPQPRSAREAKPPKRRATPRNAAPRSDDAGIPPAETPWYLRPGPPADTSETAAERRAAKAAAWDRTRTREDAATEEAATLGNRRAAAQAGVSSRRLSQVPWYRVAQGHSTPSTRAIQWQTARYEDQEDSPLSIAKVALGETVLTLVGMASVSPSPIFNNYLAEGTTTATYLRALLGLEARRRWASAFVNLETAHEVGVGGGLPDDLHPIGLFEAYGEVTFAPFFVRAGRQELGFGSLRLISPRDPTYKGRSFDALRGHGAFGPLTWDLVVAAADIRDVAANQPDTSDLLGVLYTSYALAPTHQIDPSVMVRRGFALGGDLANASLETEVTVNLGLRATGDRGSFHYDAEINGQLGRHAGLPHRAFAGLAELDYVFAPKIRPTVGGGVAYASGASPSGSVSAFDGFYPENLLNHGYASYFSLTNLIDIHARCAISPFTEDFTITTTVLMLGLAESSDTWVGAYGDAVGQVTDNTSVWMGGEWDVELRYTPTAYLYFDLVYGLFLPTEAAAAFGASRPSHTLWATAILNFGLLGR